MKKEEATATTTCLQWNYQEENTHQWEAHVICNEGIMFTPFLRYGVLQALRKKMSYGVLHTTKISLLSGVLHRSYFLHAYGVLHAVKFTLGHGVLGT